MKNGNKSNTYILDEFEKLYHPKIAIVYHENHKNLIELGGSTVADFFERLNVDQFVDAIFHGLRYGYLCSNIVESYSKWIIREWQPPITTMIDKIRQL